MVTKKLVLNFDLGGGVKVDTYILLYKDKPILAPNLYLFKMAKSGFLISAIKTYSDCLKKFFNVLFDAQIEKLEQELAEIKALLQKQQ